MAAQQNTSSLGAITADENLEATRTNEDREDMINDDMIYEQNRVAIEAKRAKKPLSRGKASEREKLAHWKSKHPSMSGTPAATSTQRSVKVHKRP